MKDELVEHLNGYRILIVEDEFMIAVDLADSLERLGAIVVGPAGSVEDAFDLIDLTGDEIDGAILDINLRGHRIYPVAERLKAKGTPFVFLTGYDDLVLPEAFADVPRCDKPVDIRQLAKALFRSRIH